MRPKYGEGLRLREERCSSERPCGKCQGHCERDSHCRGDNLRCFQRTNKTNPLEEVPNCMGEGLKGADYCYPINPELEEPQDTKLEDRNRPCMPYDPCYQCTG